MTILGNSNKSRTILGSSNSKELHVDGIAKVKLLTFT
jgi:hypothetical protein